MDPYKTAYIDKVPIFIEDPGVNHKAYIEKLIERGSNLLTVGSVNWNISLSTIINKQYPNLVAILVLDKDGRTGPFFVKAAY